MKRGEFLLAEELLASKDGLYSLELLSYACFWDYLAITFLGHYM